MASDDLKVYVAGLEDWRPYTGLPAGTYCIHVYADDPEHPVLMYKPAGARTFLPALPLTQE